jgi:hypothetical protein
MEMALIVSGLESFMLHATDKEYSFDSCFVRGVAFLIQFHHVCVRYSRSAVHKIAHVRSFFIIRKTGPPTCFILFF